MNEQNTKIIDEQPIEYTVAEVDEMAELDAARCMFMRERKTSEFDVGTLNRSSRSGRL